ncbi:Small ribosomal subunit biogenesis GTPase RsgA [Streptomyces tendae]
MRRYGKHTDEDDIRSRPNRKGNRPRTHIRPKHEDAAEGLVLTVDRGRLTCLVEDRVVMAMKARELGRKAAVVGDRVALVGDLSGKKDTLARIVRIAERASVLRRTADDDDPYERVVVANADQLAIVTALADPEPRPRLIDRCLVAAFDGGLDPAAGDDQVGPGTAGRSSWSCTAPWTSRTSSPAARSWRTAPRRSSCASTWTGRSPPSSATPASARRRWSTPWCRRTAAG